MVWEKRIRKTLYTLDIDNYQPAIKALTFPLMQAYAQKIGADFFPITERKFPGWPIVYEKLQIYQLGRGSEGLPAPDWNIFFDADALISPEMFDITCHLDKSTVCFAAKDMAGIRWKYDQYFRRDARHIGTCGWFACASDWCLDLWHPLEDMTLQEALGNIAPTMFERKCGMFGEEHFVDDYTLSRNIARYGLRHTTAIDVCGNLGIRGPQGQPANPFFFHLYGISEEEKLNRMLNHLSRPRLVDGKPVPLSKGWCIMSADEVRDFRKKWGLRAAEPDPC